MTIDWNYAQFNQQLRETILVTERGAADVVKQQTKLFLRDVVKFTPPTGNAPVNESFSTQRQFGLKAIKGDIRRAFIPVEEMSIIKNPENPKLAERIKRYAKREEYDQLSTLFKRIGINNNVVAFPTEPTHNAVRNNRGRVPERTKQTIVVRRGTVEDFTKKKQGLSGLAKSGWVKACDALGVILPNWVKKHTGPGIYRGSLNGPAPFITVGNEVDFIQSAGARLRIIQRALDRRTESMRHQIEKMMGQSFSGYKGQRSHEIVGVE